MWKKCDRVKCKNCIHLNVCDGLYFNLDKDCERTCGYFEDRSKYVEVVHGRFVDAECSVCRWFGNIVETRHYNYCPNCGAKMDGDNDA
jgi:hypothetical protein